MDDIDQLLKNFQSDLASANDLSQLDQINIKYLGRNGLVNQLLSKIKEITPDQRKEFGQNLNQVKIKEHR